jgi:hypothetical protein
MVLVGKQISHALGIPCFELLDRNAPMIAICDGTTMSKLVSTVYEDATLVVLEGQVFANSPTRAYMDNLSQVFGLPTIAVCWSKD